MKFLTAKYFKLKLSCDAIVNAANTSLLCPAEAESLLTSCYENSLVLFGEREFEITKEEYGNLAGD